MDKDKLQTFMYALMKEAMRDSFMEFLEHWDLTEDDFDEIQKHFEGMGIKLL